MCDLCDPETVDAAREKSRGIAQRLEELAGFHRSIANGVIKPHTEAMTRIIPRATAAIRNLVEEWL